MPFKHFKAVNQKPCVICGETVNKIKDYKDMAYLDDKYSAERDNLWICSECYSILHKTKLVTKIIKQSFRAELATNVMNEYKKDIRTPIIQRQKNIRNPWIKDDVYELITEADRVCNEYDAFPDIIHTAIDTINDSLKRLPDDRIDCEISTFAKNEEYLFYMEYGRPVAENDDLLKITDPVGRLETSKELMNNVIHNKTLIKFIPLEKILYFQERGDISYSTDVSGGGGGKVNVGGAVLGTVLFGVVGGIVGSKTGEKAKQKEIKSETIEHDNRYVSIRYIGDGGKTIERKCGIQYLDVFNSLIPEKEYAFIQLQKSEVPEQKETENRLPIEELKKLKELLDIGVINLDDFEKTKKRLLGIE